MEKKIKKLLRKNKNLRIAVWFIGSFSSGKTTQCKIFCNKFSEKPIFVDKLVLKKGKKNVKIKATFFNEVSNIGLLKDNSCSGADTITDKVSRSLSIRYCSRKSNIVLVDGAMATNTWWQMFLKNFDIILLVYLYHKKIKYNIQFLNNRRGLSLEEPIKEKTMKNLMSHRARMKSMYRRSPEFLRVNDGRMKLLATLSKEEINEKIMKKVYFLIKNYLGK